MASSGTVRQQPRQIYTSVRSRNGFASAAPTGARRIVVTLLGLLALATIVVAILSLL